jgi:hypothetical protein
VLLEPLAPLDPLDPLEPPQPATASVTASAGTAAHEGLITMGFLRPGS